MIAFMKTNGLITGEVKAEDLYTNQFVPGINQFDTAKVREVANSLPK